MFRQLKHLVRMVTYEDGKPPPVLPLFRRRPFQGADVSVQLVFIGEFTSNYNPIVGVVADEATALKLFHRHTEHKISWEQIAVSDATETPAPGSLLWVLIQGGPLSPTAYSNPSPVAAYADKGRALEEIARRKQLYVEELLLWRVPLGTIDFTAPDWSYAEA